MKEILNHLFENKTLSKAEAKLVLTQIASGAYNSSQMVAFMTAFCMRSITVEELEGFRDAMLELCIKVDLQGYNTIDVCGTGGDGKDTFNISTLASFVVAGAGYRVAKHGNYGVSSNCGSSNVMEELGYRFTNNIEQLKKDIETTGICFMHAPLFHPAMKTVAPLRKEMGVKTFFNMLGPMVNPASPANQLVGVFSLELARLYAYLYQKTDKNFMVIHTLQGYDEITLTGPFKMYSNAGEQVIDAEYFGFEKIHPALLKGGKDINESADLFMNVLNGKGSPAQNKVVISNAAMAIQCLNPAYSIENCIAEAHDSLMAKTALKSFKQLISTQA